MGVPVGDKVKANLAQSLQPPAGLLVFLRPLDSPELDEQGGALEGGVFLHKLHLAIPEVEGLDLWHLAPHRHHDVCI